MPLPNFPFPDKDHLSRKGAVTQTDRVMAWLDAVGYDATPTLAEIEMMWWRLAPVLVDETDNPQSQIGPGSVAWVLAVFIRLEIMAERTARRIGNQWRKENPDGDPALREDVILRRALNEANGHARARFEHAYRAFYKKPFNAYSLSWYDPLTGKTHEIEPWPDSPETLAAIEAWETGMNEI